MAALKEGQLTVTRERVWGQYRRPNEPVLVKLPADSDSMPRYIKKGFTFIKFGGDELPIAVLDTSLEQLQKIAPEAVVIPSQSVVVEQTATTVDEPELYVSDKPYKSKKKKKRR